MAKLNRTSSTKSTNDVKGATKMTRTSSTKSTNDVKGAAKMTRKDYLEWSRKVFENRQKVKAANAAIDKKAEHDLETIERSQQIIDKLNQDFVTGVMKVCSAVLFGTSLISLGLYASSEVLKKQKKEILEQAKIDKEVEEI